MAFESAGWSASANDSSRRSGEAIGALKAGDQLGGNLTAATTLLYSQKLQPDSKDFEQTVRMYNRIEERIGKVTKLLADNRATIYRDKVEFIPKALLPVSPGESIRYMTENHI